MNTEHLKKIDDVLKEMTKVGYVAGASCMVLQDGKEVYYGEEGLVDIENNKPVKRDSIFRLYSMSKPITSAAAMLLVEDGKLDLASPVGDYIPSFRNQTYIDATGEHDVLRPMKVKDLLDMTGGLTYGGDSCKTEIMTSAICDEAINRIGTNNEMTTLEFVSRLGEVPLIFSPGTHYRYSYCADVLGAVIEVASGMKFGDFLKKRLFEPLGMKDTGFYVPAEKQDRLVKVYGESSDGTKLEEFTYNNLAINLKMDHAPAFESGGAGLCTTIEDYSHFANMLMNMGNYEGKKILLPGTVKYMTSGSMEEAPRIDLLDWDDMSGFQYANLLRVMKDIGRSKTLGSVGEYGWDGWLGPYFINDPAHKITILHMIQRKDAGTTTYMRRIRNVVYAAVEDWN